MDTTGPDSAVRDAAELALFRAAPVLRQQLGRVPLGSFPAPLQHLEVAGRKLLVKRDDICAEGYAGNKVRKLEFIFGEARARGAQRIITAGATGSHHALATAFHGLRLGFDISLVLFPQRVTEHVREILLMDHGTGAELRWAQRAGAVPFGLLRARWAHRRRSPFIVPPGGSSATGTIGYVNAGLELAEQVAAGDAAPPDRIHVAAGTLGTAAGMAIGLAWAGLDMPVVATRITPRMVTNERVLARLISATCQRLRSMGAEPPPAAAALRLVRITHDQLGPGYGEPTPAAERAAAEFAAAGLRLDPTYTAKAAAGLLADQSPGLPLFWHTLSVVEPRHLLEQDPMRPLPDRFARYLDSARAR
jgi:1-aminocyclopropane-1-carboxylate deaminase/D-cysteine desulfhydrase-like pyridoxal-dependent ACC family enzyme